MTNSEREKFYRDLGLRKGPRVTCICARWSQPCLYHEGFEDALEFAFPVMTEDAIVEAMGALVGIRYCREGDAPPEPDPYRRPPPYIPRSS